MEAEASTILGKAEKNHEHSMQQMITPIADDERKLPKTKNETAIAIAACVPRLELFNAPQNNNDGSGKSVYAPQLEANNINKVNGWARIGNAIYVIEKGQVYKSKPAIDSAGALEKGEHVGILEAGYKIKLDKSGTIDLASEKHILLQYKIEGELNKSVHRIISSGNAAAAGLIDADKVLEKSLSLLVASGHDQESYAGSASMFTASLADWIAGSRLQLMADMQANLASQVKIMARSISSLFAEGCHESTSTDKLDGYLHLTQKMMQNCAETASASRETLDEGKQIQKQVNDATVMAASAILTAGTGAAIAGAAELGATAITAVTATGVLSTALLTAGMRQTGQGGAKEFARNTAAGALEATTMLAGGASANVIRSLPAVAKLGAYAADAVVQSGLFAASAAVRGEKDVFTVQNIAAGSTAMIFGHGMAEFTNSVVANALKRYIPDKKVVEHLLATPISTLNGFSYGALNSIPSYLDSERTRLAEQRHSRPDDISNADLWSQISLRGLAAYAASSGAMAALPIVLASPLTSRLATMHSRDKQTKNDTSQSPANNEIKSSETSASKAESSAKPGNKTIEISEESRRPVEKSKDSCREPNKYGSPLHADEALKLLCDTYLPVIEKWHQENLNAEYQAVKQAEQLSIRSAERAITLIDEKLGGYIHIKEFDDPQHMHALLLAHADLENVYQQYLTSRSEFEQAHESFEGKLASRLATLKELTEPIALKHEIPWPLFALSSTIEAKRAKGRLIEGTYTPGAGIISIAIEGLLAKDPEALANTIAHELTHAEQESLVVRRLADLAGVGAPEDLSWDEFSPLTFEQIDRIQDSYSAIYGGQIAPVFLKNILASRFAKLNETQTQRANALILSETDCTNNPDAPYHVYRNRLHEKEAFAVGDSVEQLASETDEALRRFFDKYLKD